MNDDAVQWLLERDGANPGVRYYALQRLLDRPADDPDVIEAQAAVMSSGPVPVIPMPNSRTATG